MKKIGNSFILTICLSMAFFVTIVVFIVFIFYKSTLKNTYEVGYKSAESVAYASSSFLLENVDIVGLQAETIDYMLSNGENNDAIKKYMVESTTGYQKSINNSFSGFYGFIKGEYVDGTGWDPGESYDPMSRPWYVEAIAAKGETIITTPYLDQKEGVIMVSIVSALSNKTDVVAVDISLDSIDSIVKEMARSVNGECFILDGSGMVVSSSIDDKSVNYLRGQAGSEKKKIAKKIFEEGNEEFEFTFEGEKSIVFSKSFVNDWHVVLILHKADVLKNSYIDLMTAILASLILVIVLLLFCNYSYRKRMDAENSLSQVKAVSAIYVSVDDINLVNNSFKKISNAKHIEKLIGNDTSDAQAALYRVLGNVSIDEYYETILNFINLSTLPERMKGKKTIACEFVGKTLGWCRARFIEVERDEEDRPTRVLLAINNINQEKAEQQRLLSESTVDGLSGCFNRRAYENAIKEYDEKLPENFTFVSMDLNGLKAANDDLGHAAGDELIVGAANLMKDVLRTYGKVYRIGGDEFVAMLEVDMNTSIELIANLRKAVYEWHGKLIESLSLSIGFVTRADYPDYQIEELAKLADKLMYEDKTKYYKMMGIDRRAQQDAYDAICESYAKIIECNLTFDSFRIVKITDGEQDVKKGFRETLSQWLREFAMAGQVHPDDVDRFLKNTDLDNLRQKSLASNGFFNFRYRRMINGEYKEVLFEMIPSKKYTEENQIVFITIMNLE